MKKYTTISSTLTGILSDDHLYFEGISRPSQVYAIRDNSISPDDNINVLEKYFNDIYNLFLRKLSSFAMFEVTDDEDSMKMQALLQELIKVKKMIEHAPVDSERELL